MIQTVQHCPSFYTFVSYIHVDIPGQIRAMYLSIIWREGNQIKKNTYFYVLSSPKGTGWPSFLHKQENCYESDKYRTQQDRKFLLEAFQDREYAFVQQLNKQIQVFTSSPVLLPTRFQTQKWRRFFTEFSQSSPKLWNCSLQKAVNI